jgi:hypothetical protein
MKSMGGQVLLGRANRKGNAIIIKNNPQRSSRFETWSLF